MEKQNNITLIMKKEIKKVLNNLKAVFGKRYIDISKTKKINKNGVLCFY